MNRRKNAQIYRLITKLTNSLDNRDVSEAMRAAKRILTLDKRSVEGALFRGRIHGFCGEFDQAEIYFGQAIQSSPPSQRAHAALRAAKLSVDLYDRTLAIKLFRKSLGFAQSPEAALGLANALLQSRKTKEAVEVLGELRSNLPTSHAADLLWTKLNPNHERSEALLVNLCNTPDSEIRLRAKYQLAQLFDRQGDYKSAFEAFTDAKQMLIPAAERRIERRHSARIKMRASVDALSPADLCKWKESVNLNEFSEKGIALLGGHPRSGTTLVEQILDSHQEIVSVEESEVFQMAALVPAMRIKFAKHETLEILRGLSPAAIAKARETYFSWMRRYAEKPLDGRLLIDKNPSLTAFIPSIKRLLPEMKLITMIRDPRDVIVSCFMQPFFPLNDVTASFLTLEQAAEEYSAVMGVLHKTSEMLSGDLMQLKYENLVDDPTQEIDRLFGFLGLQGDPEVLNFHVRAQNKVVRSPTADAVTEKLHTRAKGRWQNYARYVEPLEKKLHPFLKNWGYA